MEEVEWPEERCLRLIEEFRNRPILWHKEDPLFYKKNMKSECWFEIGKALNVAPEICRHKMMILLSSFRREKSKLKKSSRQSRGFITPYISSWFGFKPLSFLLDMDRKRKRKSTENSQVEDDSLLCDDEEDITSIPDPDTSEVYEWEVRPAKLSKISVRDDLVSTVSCKRETPSPATPLNNSIEVPLQNSTADPLDDSTAGLLNDSTASQSNSINEIKFFSNFIASKMMKYSNSTKNAVQQEICNIIFKADQNFYDKKQKSQEHASAGELSKPQVIVCEQKPSSSDGAMKLYCYSDSD